MQVKIRKDELDKLSSPPSDEYNYSQITITYQFRTGVFLVMTINASLVTTGNNFSRCHCHCTKMKTTIFNSIQRFVKKLLLK